MKKLILSTLIALLLTFTTFTQQQDDLKDIAGTYKGKWTSNDYNVSGTVVMIVTFTNNKPEVKVVFTGSEYLNEDILISTFTSIGDGIWKMTYKGKKTRLSGTGIFDNGRFDGDYKFRKLLWKDTGKWLMVQN